MRAENTMDDLLNVILKWRTIKLKDLSGLLGSEKTMNSVYSAIKRLKAKGMLNSYQSKNTNAAIIQITTKAIKHYGDKECAISSETYIHDAYVTSLCILLGGLSNVQDCSPNREYSPQNKQPGAMQPDAEIFLLNDGALTSHAVEVELTQKSKTRIRTKFAQYSSNKQYEKVVYAFTDINIATAYLFNLYSLTQPTPYQINKFNIDKFIFILLKEPVNTSTNTKASFSVVYPDINKNLDELLNN